MRVNKSLKSISTDITGLKDIIYTEVKVVSDQIDIPRGNPK